jgi:predicted signal transduction protein with EAL and GGDEF domain
MTSTRDPLTGLPNRTLILDRVEQILARSVRSQTPLAVLFLDLDKTSRTSTTRSGTPPAMNCCTRVLNARHHRAAHPCANRPHTTETSPNQSVKTAQ